MERRNVALGNPYEDLIGFPQAVRVGRFISAGGTAPVDDDGRRHRQLTTAAKCRHLRVRNVTSCSGLFGFYGRRIHDVSIGGSS